MFLFARLLLPLQRRNEWKPKRRAFVEQHGTYAKARKGRAHIIQSIVFRPFTPSGRAAWPLPGCYNRVHGTYFDPDAILASATLEAYKVFYAGESMCYRASPGVLEPATSGQFKFSFWGFFRLFRFFPSIGLGELATGSIQTILVFEVVFVQFGQIFRPMERTQDCFDLLTLVCVKAKAITVKLS